jgi:hypothetical protein
MALPNSHRASQNAVLQFIEVSFGVFAFFDWCSFVSAADGYVEATVLAVAAFFLAFVAFV